MTADESRRIYDKLDEIHHDLRAREVEHVALCGCHDCYGSSVTISPFVWEVPS